MTQLTRRRVMQTAAWTPGVSLPRICVGAGREPDPDSLRQWKRLRALPHSAMFGWPLQGDSR